MAPYSSEAPSKDKQQGPLEKTLLERHRTFIATVNDRTFEKAHASTEWVASDFTAELMNFPFISSWGQYCEMFRDIVTASPEYFINVLELTAHVREDLGRVEVFCLAEEIGQPPGVKTLATSKLTWRRELTTGKWLLWKHQMVRGADWDSFGL